VGRIFTAVAVAGALTVGAVQTAGTASALTIIGGETAVTVTADLAGLGLTPGLVGTASFGDPVMGFPTVLFPITGGDAGASGAVIEHDGSGVSLTAGATTASVGNFVVDTGAAEVRGDLLGVTTGSPLPFFDFGSETALPGVQLTITSTLAGALSDVFGAPDLAGATFGYAVPAPQIAPVPLPAGALLLIGGLGMFGLVRRKRAA
jgi:hypothetical protein